MLVQHRPLAGIQRFLLACPTVEELQAVLAWCAETFGPPGGPFYDVTDPSKERWVLSPQTGYTRQVAILFARDSDALVFRINYAEALFASASMRFFSHTA
jgi:hypothetical protein